MNRFKSKPNGNRTRRDATDAIVSAYLAEQYEPVTNAQIHRDTLLGINTIKASLERVAIRVGMQEKTGRPGPATPLWVGR